MQNCKQTWNIFTTFDKKFFWNEKNHKVSKFILRTISKGLIYLVIILSIVSNSAFTWETTNLESPQTLRFFALSVPVKLNPAIKASYLASLFIFVEFRFRAYSIVSKSGLCETKPGLLVFVFDDPSKYSTNIPWAPFTRLV